MRADRLVAILLLLQRRGQVTAGQVAEELEVSERTARRDLDALGMAGIPIYAVQGRGGGWRLAGGGTTDLSGLNAAEAGALFVMAGASGLANPETKAALRKLVRALPESMRDRAEAAGNAVVVDPTTWDRTGGISPPALLERAQHVVIDARQIRLAYTARDGAITTRVVEPLGVAAKGSTWYLLAATSAGRRMFRVDRISGIDETGEPATRPDGFDLAEEWRVVVDGVDRLRTPITAHGRVDPQFRGALGQWLGTRASCGPAEADGWIPIALRGHSVRSLAAEIAGFGRHLVMVDPPELLAALAEIGEELRLAYR